MSNASSASVAGDVEPEVRTEVQKMHEQFQVLLIDKQGPKLQG